MTKIAVLAGSTRAGSFNRALGGAAARALEAAGAEVTTIDLAEYELPLYSAALEADAFPADARRLKQVLAAQHGLLVVTPEYNGSIPPLLKNAIDWASRPTDGEAMLALSAYRGKAAAVMSASLSPFGGMRAVTHLRQILGTVQMLVIPEQVQLPAAHMAFDEQGALKDAMVAGLVNMTAASLVRVAAALAQGAS